MPIEVRRRFCVKGVVVSRIRNEQLIIVRVLVERHDTAHNGHGFRFCGKEVLIKSQELGWVLERGTAVITAAHDNG